MSIRYERRLPTTGGDDRYNAFAFSPFSTGQIKKTGNSMEYWTNGTTTLLTNPITSAAAATIAKNQTSKESSSSSSFNFPSKDQPMTVTSSTTAQRHPPKQTALPKSGSQSQNQHHHHVVRNSLISGSMAGIVSTLLCHPLDVIRTKMQTSSLAASQAVSQTLQQGQGLRSLYAGLAFPLATQAAYKATIFTVYNLTLESLVGWKRRELLKTGQLEPYSLTLMDRFVCGAVGGAINAALFVTPVEYIRHQIGKQPQPSLCHPHRPARFGPDVVQTLIRVKTTLLQLESAKGLWRGMGITIARDTLGCACFFYSLAWSQKLLASARLDDPTQQHLSSVSDNLASGAVAGLAYWAVALPLDRLKTSTFLLQRQQQEQQSYSKSSMSTATHNHHHSKILSATQVVQTSLRERGPLETMQLLLTPTSRASHHHNGMGMACYARGIPSAAIVVATYSFCYNALQQSE